MKKKFAILIFCLFLFAISIFAQEARKIDEFGNESCDNFRNLLDIFFNELKGSKDAKGYIFDFCDFNRPTQELNYPIGRGQSPLFFNLFGVYENVESLVLTYNNQMRFSRQLIENRRNFIPDKLLSEIQRTKFFLFLGFDFEDWMARQVCDTLIYGNQDQIESYAFSFNESMTAFPIAL